MSNINNIVIQEISNLIFDIYFMIIRIIAYNVKIITFLNKPKSITSLTQVLDYNSLSDCSVEKLTFTHKQISTFVDIGSVEIRLSYSFY